MIVKSAADIYLSALGIDVSNLPDNVTLVVRVEAEQSVFVGVEGSVQILYTNQGYAGWAAQSAYLIESSVGTDVSSHLLRANPHSRRVR